MLIWVELLHCDFLDANMTKNVTKGYSELTLCTCTSSSKGKQAAKTLEQLKEWKKGGRGEEEQYLVISTCLKFFCTLLIKKTTQILTMPNFSLFFFFSPKHKTLDLNSISWKHNATPTEPERLPEVHKAVHTCRTFASRVRSAILLSADEPLAHQPSSFSQFLSTAVTSFAPCCLRTARSLKLWSNMPFKTLPTWKEEQQVRFLHPKWKDDIITSLVWALIKKKHHKSMLDLYLKRMQRKGLCRKLKTLPSQKKKKKRHLSNLLLFQSTMQQLVLMPFVYIWRNKC